MDAKGFMEDVERDAARRAKEREQRGLVAANMRKYADKSALNFRMSTIFLVFEKKKM